MKTEINQLPVSHVAKDVSHRCDNAADVALNCREWANSLRQELHPATLTLFAAATMIDSQAEEIARLRWELKAATEGI